MKTVKYLSFLAVTVLLGLTSCLDKGEETFALEKGDFDSLLETGWKVSSCSLYDPIKATYDSELVNEDLLDYIYVLNYDDVSAEIEPDGTGRRISWEADEADHTLTLSDKTYTIESLGKDLMILTQPAVVNGNSYIKKFYLRNIGSIDNLDEIEDSDENTTYVVSTDGFGYFRRNGYGFTVPKGAVPKGDNGSNGSVAFSAQSVPLEQLPSGAPEGITFVEGSGILANPTNFIFASPIIIDVPLRGYSVGETVFLWWNGIQRKWETVPYSSLKSAAYARTSVIELGYFVLGVRNTNNAMGGIKVNRHDLSSDYFYYLTLSSKSGNNNNVSIAFSSNGEDIYMANVPQGEYRLMVSRERRPEFSSDASSLESCKTPLDIVVAEPLVIRGNDLKDFTGWTIVDLTGIEWEDGRPASWGDETVTYGTGAFQATLNWINYAGSTTDYDLHLTTPNGTEIYFGHKTGDGFELDRDVISTIGNCTENIYSVSESLPKGTYLVRVHHYSGATQRNYNCRVILNGRVVSAYSGITNSGYQDIYRFTLQ